MTNILKPIATILGSGLIITGCFFPILEVTDHKYGFFDAMPVTIPGVPENALVYTAGVFILLAVVSLLLWIAGKNKFNWITGITCAALLAALHYSIRMKTESLKEDADKQIGNLFGGMFKGVTESLFQTVQISGAGWYLITSGAAVLILSSFIPTKQITTTTI